jgi:methenyltetrahydromethanopterin cyclohydrolase
MARHDLDVGMEQLAEPIEFVIGGKPYIVTKITSRMIDEITSVKEDDSNAIGKQFAKLVNADPEDFADVDIRILAKALNIIKSTVTDVVEKNASKAGANQ